MKKQLLFATGLAVLSSSVFATKARMEALGQDSRRGSHFIEDSRNMFRNASTLNDTKNFVVTEWGFESSSSTTEEPEGGFFREMGSFAYGIYLGDESSDQTKSAVNSNDFMSQDNALDLFFAGDMGLKWGARVHYASSKDESTNSISRENSALGLGFGIQMGDLDAYANIDLKNESKGAETAADKWEADTGINAGVAYEIGHMHVFVDYSKFGYGRTPEGTAKDTDEQTVLEVGVGKVNEVSSTARVFTQISYDKETHETKDSSGTLTKDDKVTKVPVVIGFEADATSWLTLRGSVKQNIIGSTKNKDGKKVTDANSTDVAAGATLNFGKLKVDGVIGTEDSGTSEKGNLRTDRFMSKVAVHYWF